MFFRFANLMKLIVAAAVAEAKWNGNLLRHTSSLTFTVMRGFHDKLSHELRDFMKLLDYDFPGKESSSCARNLLSLLVGWLAVTMLLNSHVNRLIRGLVYLSLPLSLTPNGMKMRE